MPIRLLPLAPTIATPSCPLPSAVVPEGVVPTKLPLSVVPEAPPLTRTPLPRLPETRLPCGGRTKTGVEPLYDTGAFPPVAWPPIMLPLARFVTRMPLP